MAVGPFENLAAALNEARLEIRMRYDVAVAQDRSPIPHLSEGVRADERRVAAAVDKSYAKRGQRSAVRRLPVEIQTPDQTDLARSLTDKNRSGEKRVGKSAHRSLDVAGAPHPGHRMSERALSHDVQLLDRQFPHRDRRMAGDEGLQGRRRLLGAQLGQQPNNPMRLKAMFELIDQDHRGLTGNMPLQTRDEQPH